METLFQTVFYTENQIVPLMLEIIYCFAVLMCPMKLSCVNVWLSGILVGFSWLSGSTGFGNSGNERKKLICFIGVLVLGLRMLDF